MNILWTSTRLAHASDDGARMYSYPLLRELNREHPVTYVTCDDGEHASDAAARAAEYCTTLVRVPSRPHGTRPASILRDLRGHLTSPLPYTVWRCDSEAMQRKIDEIVRDQRIDILISDSLAACVNVPAALPAPAILLRANIEAISWYRRAVLASGAVRKRYLQRQWYRMYAFERNQCRRFDHVLAVSPEDLAWITVEYGVPHATRTPMGVDTQLFKPLVGAYTQPDDIALLGSEDATLNEDTVSYFATEILPRIPDPARRLRVSIVCREPTARVQSLSRLDPRLQLSDSAHNVPSALARASVIAMPRRIGGGTRTEVLESMAMERPVVTTTVGVEGLPVRDGEHLLTANTPEQFASSIAGLLANAEMARSLASRGAALVRSELSWANAAAAFAETCRQVLNSESLRRRSQRTDYATLQRGLADSTHQDRRPLKPLKTP